MTFIGGLQLLFIALKLTDYVDWSWLVVMLPFYIIIVTIAVLAFMVRITEK